jgi:hypothetical protein
MCKFIVKVIMTRHYDIEIEADSGEEAIAKWDASAELPTGEPYDETCETCGVRKALPEDYEACCDCGFDHEYEPQEAQTWHIKHGAPSIGIPPGGSFDDYVNANDDC